MIIKYIIWEKNQFFYIEDATTLERWWPVSLFLKLYRIKTSPKRALEKYELVQMKLKNLQDLKLSYAQIPKQTHFLKTQDLIILLRVIQSKKLKFSQLLFESLIQTLQNPTSVSVSKIEKKSNKSARKKELVENISLTHQESLEDLTYFMGKTLDLANQVHIYILQSHWISSAEKTKLLNSLQVLNVFLKEIPTNPNSSSDLILDEDDTNIIDI